MRQKLPAGLGTCARCDRVFRREVLVHVTTGDRSPVSYDPRPKGPAGWRIGWEERKRFTLEQQLLVCPQCGGRPEPVPTTTGRDSLKAAWQSDPNADWAKLAPRWARK